MVAKLFRGLQAKFEVAGWRKINTATTSKGPVFEYCCVSYKVKKNLKKKKTHQDSKEKKGVTIRQTDEQTNIVKPRAAFAAQNSKYQ